MWLTPPESPTLEKAGSVHVWRAALDLGPELLDKFRRTLAPDEAERAGWFYFPRDRDRFVAARGLLRRILGLYLGRPPEALGFVYGSKGKPSLADNDPRLQFNVAHSHGLALYAVALEREVGVDVEQIRAELARERIAERFFSPAEVAALRAVPAEEQPAAFFRCWTRKEAFLKGCGKGLTFGLDQFTVSFTAAEPAAILATPFDPGEASRWSLRHLDPGPGYAGALAVRGGIAEVRCWRCGRQ